MQANKTTTLLLFSVLFGVSLPVSARYLTSDPIGISAGPNTYLYAHANSIRYIDRFGLETTVITVRDHGIGTHSAVHVDNGPSGSPSLYDPAGSYLPPSGIPPGSGDMHHGQNANLDDYRRYHEQRGSEVETTTLPTTPEQEREIARRADQIGGSSPFACTFNASSALGGVCDIGISFFPGGLADDASNAQCK